MSLQSYVSNLSQAITMLSDNNNIIGMIIGIAKNSRIKNHT